MTKYLFMLLLFLLPLLSSGQYGITTAQIPKPWNAQMPAGIADKPDFYVSGYAFYPEKKLVGISKYWIHPMSGSGIGTYYIDTLQGADYNSFIFINVDKGIAKDKNHIYCKGKPIELSLKNARIVMHSNYYDEDVILILKKDSAYIFDINRENIVSHAVDKYISDITFKKDGEIFLFNEGDYYPLSEEESEEDDDENSPPKFKLNLRKLKLIDTYIYQDNKNLYYISNGDVEAITNEKIIGKHVFFDHEEEQRELNKNNNYVWVGKKNFYYNSGKFFNYKLQSYKFLDDSFYFFYNRCLYFFEGNDNTDIPIGINGRTHVDFGEFEEGLNDEDAAQRDYNKAKPLGKYMLLYNNKELFYKKDSISYPANWDISKLEYVGQFPDRLSINLITENNVKNCCHNSPILQYSQQLFIICNNSLVPLNKIENGLEYKDFDLLGLKFLNEYYFTDGKTLYCNNEIKDNINNDRGELTPYFTSKNIDLKNIKVIERYFIADKKLYYNYLLVSNRTDLEYNPLTKELWVQRKTSQKAKLTEADFDLSFINFDKLKIISGTKYLTDENYIIYKNSVIGKVNYKSIKVISPTIIEDSQQYISENFVVEKSKLKINLFK